MSLLIVEGPRKSGKTYLVNNQKIHPVFKFDFNDHFSKWKLGKQSEITHWFGLGKEVMLHELYQKSVISNNKTLVTDRGILTNSVWGIFQGRTTDKQARKDLKNFRDLGLFKNVTFIVVQGNWKKERKKDVWDEDDTRAEEEGYLFKSFSLLLQDLGVDVIFFPNEFDENSLERFNLLLNKY
jgi:hypothetical protein